MRDLAVMLADGGDCVADLGAMRDQDVLFGSVASNSTAFRVVDTIASTPGLLDALCDAHARAREHVWSQTGAPERVTIDIDATLVTSHSDKEGATGTYKGGFGFHPILAYCEETGEALAALLRPGNAGSNSAVDHIAVIDDALAQLPASLIETIEIACPRGLRRGDTRGHRLLPRAPAALLGRLRADRPGSRRDPPDPRELVDRGARSRRHPARERADRRDHDPPRLCRHGRQGPG